MLKDTGVSSFFQRNMLIKKMYVFSTLFRRTGDKTWESLLPIEEESSLISYLIAFDSLNDHVIAK